MAKGPAGKKNGPAKWENRDLGAKEAVWAPLGRLLEVQLAPHLALCGRKVLVPTNETVTAVAQENRSSQDA